MPHRVEVARNRRRSVRLLWTASALGGLAQSLAGTAGALLARQLGGSDAVAGLPQALLVAGAAASALGLSAITRRRGRGVALSTGAGAAMAGCLLVAVAGLSASLPGVLLGSLLLGAGNTAVMLVRYAAADIGPEAARARAMAAVLVATTVGAVAGPNLLAPSGALMAGMGLPELIGPYLVAAAGFAAAGVGMAGGLGLGLGHGPSPSPGADRDETGSARPGRSVIHGLAVLGVANLVMVSVMTMAPVHLHHGGAGLGAVGLVVSVHIAGMFAPAPLSSWLADRIGAARTAAVSGMVLAIACVLVATGASAPPLLAAGLVVLGVGWNLGLVAGSVLTTAGAPVLERPRREGWGEVSMGAAAAAGGAASGLVVAAFDYRALAVAAAVVALLLLGAASRRHLSAVG